MDDIQLLFNSNSFASAFQFSGIGMALVSPSGRFLYANRVLCTMLGYGAEQLKELTFQDITHPEDLSTDLKNVELLLKGEMETYQMEKRYIAASGNIVWAKLTVSLVWDKNGKPEFFISQIEDITLAKALQQDVQNQNMKLRGAVETLEQKLNQLLEINRIIGHNFRGSVANIKLLVTLYQQKNSGLTEEQIIEMIDSCCMSMLESLGTLQKLGQITESRNLHFEDCDFASILNHVVQQLQGTISDKGASIITSWGVKNISYPRVYLESILYNLLSNALKYTRSDVKPIVLVSTYLQEGKTVLSIKDNGLGIDLQEYGHKLFQLNQTFHEGYDSKGVGLFITRSQVESLGGKISVVSYVNQGAQFIITFGAEK